MTPYAMFLVLLFACAIFFGAFVFTRAPHAQVNRLFTLFCLVWAAQALIDFGYQNSTSLDDAMLWWRLDCIWPLKAAFSLHFMLSLVNWKTLLDKRATKFVIYLPAVSFVFVDFGWHFVSGVPARQSWGWSYSLPEPNFFFYVAYTWLYSSVILNVVVAIRGILFAKDVSRRRHIQIALIGATIGLAGAVTDFVLQMRGIEGPPVSVPSFILVLFCLGYASWKHEMFSLTPGTAAENILETMTDALLLFDTHGRVIAVNNAAKDMLGWTSEELIDKDVQFIFPDLSGLPDWIAYAGTSQLGQQERIKEVETEFIGKNDRLIPISLAGAIHRNKDDSVIGFLLIGRDITRRKQTQEELEKYHEHLEELVEKRTNALTRVNLDLQNEVEERRLAEKERSSLQTQLVQAQKLEAVGRLAGGVAHDFNNLLTVICSYSDLLLTDLMPDDPNRDDVSEIYKASKRAAALTSQLLAFSRKQVIEPRIVEINDIIEGIQKMLKRIMGEDLELVFTRSTDPLHLMIDPNQLEQVLVNLLVNARDAMPDGGRVEVRTAQCFADRTPALAQSNQLEAVHLEVQDNGCGMDDETQKKIFEPFFTTKVIGKGTGLGLSTVYGIVKQNGGHIHVTSRLGEGTTFHVYLPLADPSIGNIDAPVASFAPLGDEKILLVEDEDDVRRAVHTILARHGYDVVETGDPHIALEILDSQREQIDLLLTDVVMPGMNGRTLAEIVRTNNPRMRVLFMSGYNDEIIDNHGLISQGVHLIQKPFEAVGLCTKIREVLDETVEQATLRLATSIPPPPLLPENQ